MEITSGMILREIRIRSRLTLREFCLKNDFDPVRYSLIERDELKPNRAELEDYLSLIKFQGRIMEKKHEEIE